MAEEIPRKIAIVVLLIAIVMSILGTWIAWEALNAGDGAYYAKSISNGGVGFTIFPLENNTSNLSKESENG